MTDAERVELRKLLADKVMGWKAERIHSTDLYATGIGEELLLASVWQPDIDIAQAFIVAEKIGGLEL